MVYSSWKKKGVLTNVNVNGIFNPENRFWSFVEKLANLFLLGFLWLVFSLPLVTAGAAVTGLFQYTLKLSRNEEGYVWQTFWKGFKENFLQATILWVGMAALGIFLVFDLYCCQFLPFPSPVKWTARALLASLILVYLLTSLYVFPLLAFFRVSLKNAVVHSFIMAMGNLYVSVTILVIYGIFAAIAYFLPGLFMVWLALASYFSSHFLNGVFRRYVKEEGEEG